jgi:uncharacterized protein YjbI with pentapeptide repeats
MHGRRHNSVFVKGWFMATEKHLLKLKEGVKRWNSWRRAHMELRPDLSSANLREADLLGADLTEAILFQADLARANLVGANLGEADLREANLAEAQLASADLRGADFSGADLTQASLLRANLTGANLAKADLQKTDLGGADLTGADLSQADLTDANIYSTNFANNDLSTTRGLEMAKHLAPSTVGINTIYKSRGKIPLAFLRGAGAPEVFIEYMPSLVEPASIQFYSCFISYSSGDQEFADKLYADLQNEGVRCWFARHDVKGGKKLHEQIDEAIRRYERLLLILSLNSLSSAWVETEVRNALRRERTEKNRVLFPVRLASLMLCANGNYLMLMKERIWQPRLGSTTSRTSVSGRVTIRIRKSLKSCCGICASVRQSRRDRIFADSAATARRSAIVEFDRQMRHEIWICEETLAAFRGICRKEWDASAMTGFYGRCT